MWSGDIWVANNIIGYTHRSALHYTVPETAAETELFSDLQTVYHFLRWKIKSKSLVRTCHRFSQSHIFYMNN